MHYLDFNLVHCPNNPETPAVPQGGKKLLVIYRAGAEREQFLFGILRAAGYDDPKQQVGLLPLPDSVTELDGSNLIRTSGAAQLLLFGFEPAALGFHLQLGRYVPVAVNQLLLLVADDLALINAEKQAGNTQKAGALWKAVKGHFLAH